MKTFRIKELLRHIILIALIPACIAVTGCSARGIGSNSDTLFTSTAKPRTLDADTPLSPVALSRTEHTPSDDEIDAMIDDAVKTILGNKGLAAIVKRGDRVVIKVNMVGPMYGIAGEKGRAVITDPRVTRHVAESIRRIIGDEGSIIVTDALFYPGSDPSDRSEKTSFHSAYFDRNHNGLQDENDICYDFDADGYLDGSSRARLVNLDAIPESGRFLTVVEEPILGRSEVWLPKVLRTKEQANGESEYCDTYIGLPVFKSHGFTGITGALKLHYGLTPGVINRTRHAGYGWGTGDIRLFLDWLCALNRARPFDLVIMDALTGNRKGPLNGLSVVNAYDYRTDWIETNAVLCSRDSAAIDTVETLFAGYSIASVPLLEAAFRDGIGITRPGYIDLSGYDAFFRQREYLRAAAGGNDEKRYPFADKWGNARTHDDRTPPADLTFTVERTAQYRYVLTYSAEENQPADTGIARVEVLVDGVRFQYAVTGDRSGKIHLNLNKYARKKITVKLAVWDNALNCALSGEKSIVVR
ncbi:MAG TPA: DUF362 domain-containing protein [Spirochaetota bacterium]|nr:DUF362 domain-containing protein [Spirochaetota bacterium]